MRFYVDTADRAKRHAKKLKRLLDEYGYDQRLTICQNLIAEMLGFTSFYELHQVTGSIERSLGDAFVDEDTRRARHNQQINVLIWGWYRT